MRPLRTTPNLAEPVAERTRLWRQPVVLALAAALLIIAAAFAPALWRALTHPPGPAVAAPHDAPWASDITADGALRVFSLRVPGSTLADAQARWPDGFQLGLMAPLAGSGPVSLEAYAENARPGGIAGRVILTTGPSDEQLQGWRARAVKNEVISAQTRRLTLHPDDVAQALRASITGVSFIPNAQLDAGVLRQRFGEPRRIIGAGQPAEHWLYPDRGLAILLDTQGRELMQYVPPADFERLLLRPLLVAPDAVRS